jgi:hypothetical protein
LDGISLLQVLLAFGHVPLGKRDPQLHAFLGVLLGQSGDQNVLYVDTPLPQPLDDLLHAAI